MPAGCSTCFITKAMCDDPSIKGKPIDHSVTLVGFGTDATHGDYWQVKNSWSSTWGMDGYLLIERGNSQTGGQCGILMSASYPTV